MKFSQDAHYHRNIVATPRAIVLLGLAKFPAHDFKETPPPIILALFWHPWFILTPKGSAPRVVKGPHYNICTDNYERIARASSFRFFAIESRVVAISLAPYLKFDEDVLYEMDDVEGLVIYERSFLELAESSPKI